MKSHPLKSVLLLLAFTATTQSVARGATVFGFESGLSNGQTSFSGGGLDVSLGSPLIVTEFPTFGSGGGNWFLDSGFGTPVTGYAGKISVSTSGVAGFRLLSMDLWTSNNAGANYAAGSVSLKGILAGGGSVTSVVNVNPTGNAGQDWDTTNDLSAFTGLVFTSVEITLGAGIDYVAIDNLGMEAVAAVPEPSAAWLSLIALGGLLRRRRPDRAH